MATGGQNYSSCSNKTPKSSIDNVSISRAKIFSYCKNVLEDFTYSFQWNVSKLYASSDVYCTVYVLRFTDSVLVVTVKINKKPADGLVFYLFDHSGAWIFSTILFPFVSFIFHWLPIFAVRPTGNCISCKFSNTCNPHSHQLTDCYWKVLTTNLGLGTWQPLSSVLGFRMPPLWWCVHTSRRQSPTTSVLWSYSLSSMPYQTASTFLHHSLPIW